MPACRGEDGKLHHSIGWEKVVKEAPSKAEEAAPPNGEKEEEPSDWTTSILRSPRLAAE